MRGEKSIHSHSLSLPRDYETIRDGFLNSRNLRYFKKVFVGGVGGLIEKLESAKSSVMVKWKWSYTCIAYHEIFIA